MKVKLFTAHAVRKVRFGSSSSQRSNKKKKTQLFSYGSFNLPVTALLSVFVVLLVLQAKNANHQLGGNHALLSKLLLAMGIQINHKSLSRPCAVALTFYISSVCRMPFTSNLHCIFIQFCKATSTYLCFENSIRVY